MRPFPTPTPPPRPSEDSNGPKRRRPANGSPVGGAKRRPTVGGRARAADGACAAPFWESSHSACLSQRMRMPVRARSAAKLARVVRPCPTGGTVTAGGTRPHHSPLACSTHIPVSRRAPAVAPAGPPMPGVLFTLLSFFRECASAYAGPCRSCASMPFNAWCPKLAPLTQNTHQNTPNTGPACMDFANYPLLFFHAARNPRGRLPLCAPRGLGPVDGHPRRRGCGARAAVIFHLHALQHNHIKNT